MTRIGVNGSGTEYTAGEECIGRRSIASWGEFEGLRDLAKFQEDRVYIRVLSEWLGVKRRLEQLHNLIHFMR